MIEIFVFGADNLEFSTNNFSNSEETWWNPMDKLLLYWILFRYLKILYFISASQIESLIHNNLFLSVLTLPPIW